MRRLYLRCRVILTRASNFSDEKKNSVSPQLDYPKVYLYRRIVQAKFFIDKNFEEQIDLERICSAAFFSKFHFIRLFKNSYGKTPHQYLIAVRIEEAKKFLAEGKNISEVCYGVGFESITSFTGLFKRRTGFSPHEYQKRQQKIKKETESVPLKFVPSCFAYSKGWMVAENSF